MAGGTEIREVVLKARLDTSDLEAQVRKLNEQFAALGKGSGGGGLDGVGKGARDANKDIESLHNTLKNAAIGFAAVGGAAAAFIAVINRGQGVTELSNAFDTLQKQAGSLASNELQQLRAATQGLLSDTELMRAANEALAGGLTPDRFRQVAEAADTLGDAFGKNTKVALDDLTRALVTGQEKLLKQYTIQIDNAAAEKKFADSIGLTAKQLNEAGRLEAARVAILEEINKKSEQLAGGTHTAGDAVQQLTASFNNSLDTIAKYINENKSVIWVLDSIAFAAAKAATILESELGSSLQAQIYRAEDRLKGFREKLANSEGKPASFQDFLRQQIFVESNAIDSLRGQAIKQAEEAAKRRVEIAKASEAELRKLYTDTGKVQEEAAKKAEETAKKVAAAQKELTEQLLKTNDALKLQKLSDTLDEVFSESFSPARAQAAFSPFIEEFRKATEKELRTHYKEELADNSTKATTEGLIKGLTDASVNVKVYEFSKRLEEANKEAFRATTDFFADLLTSSIDGSAQDIEATLKNALSRVAIGFAAQTAASLAERIGLSGLGNVGSAQGLGQVIAASLGFEGGGVKTLSELLGDQGAAGALTLSATALDGSAYALTSAAAALHSAAGAQAAGGVPGVPKIVGIERTDPAGLETILTKSGIVAAAIVATAITGSSVIDSFKGGQKGGFAEGAKEILTPKGALAAFASGGLSIPFQLGGGLVGDLFGGDSQKAIERENREKLIDEIIEKIGGDTFAGVNGQIKLDDTKFNVDPSKPFGPYNPWVGALNTASANNPWMIALNNAGGSAQPFGPSQPNTFGDITALVNPLAQILTEGDDKLGSDLAGIFTNAVAEADNFNEVLVNVSSLMDKLGIDAEGAKQLVTSLFLDGKISLEEFGTDLQNLNILAQDALIGPNSIAEGLAIIAKNIDGEGEDSPRVALKGLELEFKALAAAGYDSTQEIVGYFQSIGDPEVAAVFEKLGAIGVDSFDDIAAAAENNPDLIYAIFDALLNLNSELESVDASNVGKIKGEGEKAAQGLLRAKEEAKNLNRTLDETIQKQREINSFGGGRGGDGSGLGRYPAK